VKWKDGACRYILTTAASERRQKPSLLSLLTQVRESGSDSNGGNAEEGETGCLYWVLGK